MPVIRAWANGLRTNTACATPVAVEVVDEGALPEQQLFVLDAADLCPKDGSRHGIHPIAEAATLSGSPKERASKATLT